MKLIALCLLFCLQLILGACVSSQTSVSPQTSDPAALEADQAPVVTTTETASTSPPSPPSRIPPADAMTTNRVEKSTDTADSISSKHLERAQEAKNLLQVIREAGVPDDNLTPGRKEQIAVYQRQGKYQFYYFRESRLIAIGEYPRSTIEQMQQQGTYPEEVIRDFARLSP